MTYPDDVRYRAVRHYKDARDNCFDSDCDIYVDSWIDHLKRFDKVAFDSLLVQQPIQTPNLNEDKS